MTIINAINEADQLKPNMYGMQLKITWLSRLDKRIFEQILLTHEMSDEEMEPYLPDGEETEETDPSEAINALDLPWPEPDWNEKYRKLVFPEYTEDDSEKELLVGQPYDELYVHWLCAQIDWNNREYEGYNNENAMFESVYRTFRNAYNRSHMPLQTKKKYF